MSKTTTGPSQPRYTLAIEKDVRIQMRDGAILYADVYRPQEDGKFPAIKVRVNRAGVQVRARRGYLAPSAAEMTRAGSATAPAIWFGRNTGGMENG